MLTFGELERYKRQIAIFGEQGQKKLAHPHFMEGHVLRFERTHERTNIPMFVQ